MTARPHIHFHSDCPFFAGCENMLVNFFHDKTFTNEFQVTFTYRYTPSYESGLQKRVQSGVKPVPVRLLDVSDYANKLSYKPAGFMLKVLSSLLLMRYWAVLWNTFVLYRIFRKEQIDLLHVNNGGYPGAYSCMSAVFAARLRGIRTIAYVVNNVAIPYTSLYRWLDYPFDRLVSRFVSVFITGSDYARKALEQVLSLPPSKMKSIHNGIARRPITETREKVRQRLSITQDRVVVSVVALLEKRKGHRYLVEAMQVLTQTIPAESLPLVLIEGTGSELQCLNEQVRHAGLSEEIRFIGTESDIFNLLNAVDVIVLPSISHEDFPNIVLEAMSLGKTVIASKLSGVPEQIVHGESGLLVDPMDVQGLAEALQRVHNDPQLRLHLGTQAFRRFNELFRSDIAVNNYRRLYLNLITKENTL
jgi:glycosyltransferase involved in cell wall biosynthesis